MTTGLGLCLLLSQFGSVMQPLRAQTPPPVNCRTVIQQDVEEQANRLESEASQYVDRGEVRSVIARLGQGFQIASKLSNERLRSVFLERTIEGYNFQESRLGRIVTRTEPAQRTEVLKFLTQLEQFTQRLSSGYSASKTRTFTSIATAYRTLGETERASTTLTRALQTSRLIQGAEIQSKALVPIAQEFLALKRSTEAEQVLAQSLQLAQQVKVSDPFRKSFLFEPIASTYAQLDLVETSLKIAQSVPTEYYRAKAQAEVVQSYLKNNQLPLAQQLAQKIESVEFKSNSLVAIAIQLAKSGQLNSANQFFTQALQVANADQSADYRKATLIQTYAKAGQRDRALQAAQQLTVAESKALTLGVIATEYAKAKQPQQVDRVVALLVPLIQAADTYDPVGYLQGLVSTALQEKQFKLAYDFVRNIRDGQSEWVLRVANAAIQGGDPELALQIAQGVDPNWVDIRSQLFGKVAVLYAQKNQLDRALQIAQQAQNSGTTPYRVKALAEIVSYAGTRAPAILNQAIAEANKLATPQFRALGYGLIAKAFLNANQFERAEQFLKQAIAAAKQDKDATTVTYTLRTIADDLIASQQTLAAFKVVEVMPDELERNSKVSEIFRKLLDQGQLDQAGSVVVAFQAPEVRTRALVELAQAWLNANQPQRAKTILTLAFQTAQTISDPEVRTIAVREDLIVDDDNDRASLLEAISLLFAKTGEVDAGLQVVQKIQATNLREPLRQKINCYRSPL